MRDLNRPARRVSNVNAPRFHERFRIEKAKISRSVAHNQPRAIVSQTPPFAFVGKRFEHREAETVVDKSLVCLPRQLNQVAAPIGEAFAKILGRQVMFLQNLPGGEIHHP